MMPSIPGPRHDVIVECLAGPLRLHLEVTLGIKLQVLPLQTVDDAVDLRVVLLQVVREADEIVEGAKHERAVTFRHGEFPDDRVLSRGLLQGLLMLQVAEVLVLLGLRATSPLGATRCNKPKLLADNAHPWIRA